jgi:FKBP-type peptidyl-prolyl cis-trans isomerase SlyD
MHDAQGMPLQPASDLTYLHGGYGELFAALEQALEGKGAGESILVQLEPEDTFGDYDADLLRVEPAERYGEARFYTVTDIADGKVVLDGNHPLAGMALRFSCRVVSVRTAKAEEIERGVSLP